MKRIIFHIEKWWSMNNEYIIINAYIRNVCKGINSRRIKREVAELV